MGGTGNTELDILLVDILDVPEAGAASTYKEKIRLHYDCIFYAEKCNYLVLGNVVDFFYFLHLSATYYDTRQRIAVVASPYISTSCI